MTSLGQYGVGSGRRGFHSPQPPSLARAGGWLRRRTCSRRGLISAALTALFGYLLIAPLHTTSAQVRRAHEYEVKAAYLFNFGKFVRWPQRAATDQEFVICVLGTNPFGASLQQLAEGELIGGAPLAVREVRLQREAETCRVLFISSSEEHRASAVLERLSRSPVLTVSDLPGFLDRGGMIEFVNDGAKVRFRINVDAAEQAGLSLSSELLRVAMSVRRTQAGGR